MPRFVTIGTYAKMCGINRESVYKRLKKGTLAISEHCEHPLIDIEMYPPNRQKNIHVKLEPYHDPTLPDWAR